MTLVSLHQLVRPAVAALLARARPRTKADQGSLRMANDASARGQQPIHEQQKDLNSFRHDLSRKTRPLKGVSMPKYAPKHPPLLQKSLKVNHVPLANLQDLPDAVGSEVCLHG